MEAGNELLRILAGLQDVAWTFASWSAGGLTSVRKKNKTESNERRNAEEFDLRRGAVQAATAGSIIVTKTSRGRARAAAG